MVLADETIVIAAQTKGRGSGSVEERASRMAGLEGDKSVRIRLCSGEVKIGFKDAFGDEAVVEEDKRRGRGFSCPAVVVAFDSSVWSK